MKKRRSVILDYSVYLIVRLLVCLVQSLTIERSYALARGLARIAYRLDARHRKVADQNLTLAYGAELDSAGRDRIIKGVYEHFFMVLMEILHIPRKLRPTTWRKYVTLVNYEPVLNALLDGGPMIMLTGHFGNWEMAGYLFGAFGFPTDSVARALDNPFLDRFLRSFRERTGQRLIPKKGGYDDMLRVLRNGGVLSFLADQDAGQNGMYVDFFGRPASTHKAIALLAIEHEAPIVVGYARRVGNRFHYEVGCELVARPDELTGTAADAQLLTQRYTSAIERIVRRDPEQYLWLHRRWKHQPKPKKSRAVAAPAANVQESTFV